MARDKAAEEPEATAAEDEPTQDDIDVAVAAHNDAEIAKAAEALGEPNPKDAVHGTTTTTSRDLQE